MTTQLEASASSRDVTDASQSASTVIPVNTDEVAPLMFPMQPFFARLRAGKIRLVRDSVEDFGDLEIMHQPNQDLFGACVKILSSIEHNCGRTLNPQGRFVPVGHLKMEVLALSVEAMEKIQETPGSDIPYTLEF